MDDKFLSQDEVDALLKGVGVDQDGDDEVIEEVDGPVDYDLAKDERIVRGRMPTLEVINERFGRLCRDNLFNFLRRGLEVHVKPTKISKYSDFVRNVIVPTNLNLIHMHPLRGTALFILDPTLVFLIIDTMFGGDGRFHTRVEGRDFTATEQRIITRILDIIYQSYMQAWAPVHEINVEHIRSEMNLQFVSIATPNEVVASTSFKLELGDHSAEMHICFPYTMIEPLRDILSSTMQPEETATDKQWAKQLSQQVQIAEVELITKLAQKQTDLRSVLNFKVDDIIPLNISDVVETTVDNMPVMECKYGVFNGQYALKVEKLLRVNDLGFEEGEPHG